jgi:hypothetical protein
MGVPQISIYQSLINDGFLRWGNHNQYGLPTERRIFFYPFLKRTLEKLPEFYSPPGYADLWHAYTARIKYDAHADPNQLFVLGASTAITEKPAEIPGYSLISRVGTFHIYKSVQNVSRVHLTAPLTAEKRILTKADQIRSFIETHSVGQSNIIHESANEIWIETAAGSETDLVVSNSFDPGWSAHIDDQPASVERAFLAFQSVRLPPGKHVVKLRYRVKGFDWAVGCSLLAWLTLVWLTINSYKRSRLGGPYSGKIRPSGPLNSAFQ